MFCKEKVNRFYLLFDLKKKERIFDIFYSNSCESLDKNKFDFTKLFENNEGTQETINKLHESEKVHA